MITYALDTNIITYILKKNTIVINHYITETKKGNSFIIPPLVSYEIKRGLKYIQAFKKMSAFDEFYAQFENIDFDIQVWDKAADIYVDLRKKGIPIEDADILIAAYCLVHDYVLVTNNTKHFERIEGLKYVNWMIA
jgi:Predicted nucleic acid-binding protein, contains PIN domain